MAKERYNGIFIPPEALDSIREKLSEIGVDTKELGKSIDAPHVTLEYRGAESLADYFGAKAEITITGYAVDAPSDSKFSGAVEGVAVSVSFPDNPDLQSRFETTEYSRNETCGREGGFELHITMSREGDMPAVETGYLDFQELPDDKAIKVEGCVFGGYMPDGSVDIGPDKEYSELEMKVEIASQENDFSPDKDVTSAEEIPEADDAPDNIESADNDDEDNGSPDY